MILSGRSLFGDRTYGVFYRLGEFAPGLVLDVGAAAGHVTSLALTNALGSRSISFEPFPGNWPFIEKTLADLPNARIIKAAVADKPGEMDFYVSSTVTANRGWAGYEGYSSVGYIVEQPNDRTAGKTIRVPVTTIDEHASERVLFMKIDVQGGEMNVLKGATETFARGIDILHVEFSGEADILSFLLDRDYVIFDHPYMAVPKPDADLADWDIVKEITLSTGAAAFNAWPKATPSDPEDFCRLFEDEREKVGPVFTDIVAVRRDAASRAGWI